MRARELDPATLYQMSASGTLGEDGILHFHSRHGYISYWTMSAFDSRIRWRAFAACFASLSPSPTHRLF